MYLTRIPQIDRGDKPESPGITGKTADSFFHPSRPSGFGHLIRRKSLNFQPKSARDARGTTTHLGNPGSRLRLDAGLYAPPPPRRPGMRDRPRVKGARLPSLADRLADPATRWRRTRVDQWYGRSERRLDIASGTALWHHPGMRVPIRWVLVRDPEGEKEPQAFLSTDLEADPSSILRWFDGRWRTETTFEEARRHLSVWKPSGSGRTWPSCAPRRHCSACSRR